MWTVPYQCVDMSRGWRRIARGFDLVRASKPLSRDLTSRFVRHLSFAHLHRSPRLFPHLTQHRETLSRLLIFLCSRGECAIMASLANDEADPWDQKTKQKFERCASVSFTAGTHMAADFDGDVNSKDRSEFLDPCQEAAARSIRCLHRNGGDRSMCSDYFQSVHP
jgi:cytochrome c oxidase assembly protein subunit 23